MAKRFTDSAKWDDPFFADLSNEYKLLWIYILDKCDHAGIFKVNTKMAEFCIGTKFDWKAVQGVFTGRIQTLNGEKWFIPKFIKFQYGVLAKQNRVHNSIIQILKKEGVFKPLKRSVNGRKDKDKEQDKDMVKDMEKDIIDDLNLILKTSYKPTTPKTRELISARLKEGATVEDFKTVHRKMAKVWGVDNKMRRYLRPQTLYSNKFEGYLNMSDDLKDGTECEKCRGIGKYSSATGYEVRCDCPAGYGVKLNNG